MKLIETGTGRGGAVVDLAALPRCRHRHRRDVPAFRPDDWRPDGRTRTATLLLLSVAVSNVCLSTAAPVPSECLAVIFDL